MKGNNVHDLRYSNYDQHNLQKFDISKFYKQTEKLIKSYKNIVHHHIAIKSIWLPNSLNINIII